MKHLKIIDKKIKLKIYGSIDNKKIYDEVKQRIKKYKLNNIEFCGHVQNINEILKESKVLINTSHYEGQSLSILDSLNLGTPVVSYDVKYGPKDMIDSCGGGVIIPMFQAEDAAKSIYKLVNNNNL